MTTLILAACALACPLVMGAMMLIMRGRRRRGGDEP
jgi:hypothetical protein